MMTYYYYPLANPSTQNALLFLTFLTPLLPPTHLFDAPAIQGLTYLYT